MFKIKMLVTFTNFVGAVALFTAIFRSFEAGVWAGAALVLGRSFAEKLPYFSKHKDK